MQELLELERFLSPELVLKSEDFKGVTSHIRHVPGTRLANRLIASMLRRRRNDIGKFEFEGKSPTRQCSAERGPPAKVPQPIQNFDFEAVEPSSPRSQVDELRSLHDR